jgi:protein TonB
MKNLLILLLMSVASSSLAQDKNSFYALDAKMNQTVLDSSKYILWIHETDTARWQWDYYYTWGSLLKSTRYTDHDGTIPDGRFCKYNSSGDLDSTGIFDHGKKNGNFLKFKTNPHDSIVAVWQYQYSQDSLVKSVSLLTEFQNNHNLDTANEKKSEFPGGKIAWEQYVLKTLRYPERARTKGIEGEVQVFFMVDKEGNLMDPYIMKSLEYSLDQETLRILMHSGKWDPAIKDGIPVDSFKMQVVTYKLESH